MLYFDLLPAILQGAFAENGLAIAEALWWGASKEWLQLPRRRRPWCGSCIPCISSFCGNYFLSCLLSSFQIFQLDLLVLTCPVFCKHAVRQVANGFYVRLRFFYMSPYIYIYLSTCIMYPDIFSHKYSNGVCKTYSDNLDSISYFKSLYTLFHVLFVM